MQGLPRSAKLSRLLNILSSVQNELDFLGHQEAETSISQQLAEASQIARSLQEESYSMTMEVD